MFLVRSSQSSGQRNQNCPTAWATTSNSKNFCYTLGPRNDMYLFISEGGVGCMQTLSGEAQMRSELGSELTGIFNAIAQGCREEEFNVGVFFGRVRIFLGQKLAPLHVDSKCCSAKRKNQLMLVFFFFGRHCRHFFMHFIISKTKIQSWTSLWGGHAKSRLWTYSVCRLVTQKCTADGNCMGFKCHPIFFIS